MLRVHLNKLEFVFVVTGQLDVTVAGQQITLEQGDAFTFPANAEHTFHARSGRTQVLWLVSPALPDGATYQDGVAARP